MKNVPLPFPFHTTPAHTRNIGLYTVSLSCLTELKHFIILSFLTRAHTRAKCVLLPFSSQKLSSASSAVLFLKAILSFRTSMRHCAPNRACNVNVIIPSLGWFGCTTRAPCRWTAMDRRPLGQRRVCRGRRARHSSYSKPTGAHHRTNIYQRCNKAFNTAITISDRNTLAATRTRAHTQ